ncbi:glycoside hydrolase family 125 protein [Pedobacter frigiditerrae]|uniref:Glycoside hydrolase family 125 protein n=1 Tax=Pedobacter frigiditerrae TaxID=2530452 RepID=A0A4R0MR63_9SPHI|nr:glycoside hydrolase family 125 protein [Pedobacter frigiditerrae]TCC88762.1 glycoside hydrolase family 125 protein [Pedobacter frigiditerrae]
MKRRRFLKDTGILSFGLAIAPTLGYAAMLKEDKPFVSQRPVLKNRKFVSKAIEDKILEIKKKIKDPELSWMFENCFPNTLDTTVTFSEVSGKADTYVITGDIDAMWVRDSSAQVWPYLPFIKKDKALERLVTGVINRHAHSIMIDPYANAFYENESQIAAWRKEETTMKPGVHERKWEVDSLCYVIRLAHGYWKADGDLSCFNKGWLEAMKVIVKTFKEQQRKENNGPYKFKRTTNRTSDTAAGGGFGNLVKPNGLICSVFRPSDDGTIFPYLIPSNFFAVASLTQLAEMSLVIFNNTEFANECTSLASEVNKALSDHAIVDHKKFGKMLAYEVDGYGSSYLADDANVPSLLSLPYLGAISKVNQKLYQNTRKFLLSYGDNPYYAKGKIAQGISGPHAGKDNIWPMSIIIRGMTSDKEDEIIDSLKMLKATHAGTGFMHESFYKDNANSFTRKWFAWANTLFGEFIIKIAEERPHLLSNSW